MSALGPVIDLETLLAPVAGSNPAGEDLRYSSVYSEIKAARTPAELQELGDKEWLQVKNLIARALATQSKDLQLAVWLLEALAHIEGFSGTTDGLRLIRELVERYWDSVYPQIDEEDEEPLSFRASILDWINQKLPAIVKGIPLTEKEPGYSLLHWEVTQKSGEEREALIADGWPTTEQLDKTISALPGEHWERMRSEIAACQQELKKLEAQTDKLLMERRVSASGAERFETLLSFGAAREVLENCLWFVDRAAKLGREPTPVEEPAPAEPVIPTQEYEPQETVEAVPEVAAVLQESAPASAEEALQRVFQLIDFLREDNPYRPVPYLLSRAVAWGHLLSFENVSQAQPLPAPSSELRQKLKELYVQQNWGDLLRESEKALIGEENRVWLDLHRYSLVAMDYLGNDYYRASLGIRLQLKALLRMHPDLPEAELGDGTPAAGPETLKWLREESLLPGKEDEATEVETYQPVPKPAAAASEEAEDLAVLWEQARRLVKNKKVAEALQLFQAHIGAAQSGRDRFLRKLQLAELCLEAKRQNLAFPILDELARTIDQFRLEEWEGKELVTRAWVDLVRCCRQLGRSNQDGKDLAEEIFSRLCRLDITRALSIEKD